MTIHTSTPTTQNFLDMAILQIAAESYLHQWGQLGGNNDDLFEILNAGSNNLEHVNRNDRSSWNGPTGLTRTQFDYFMANYEIVTHYPNDNSGFSATVFRDKRNNELTISFRSTEFKLDSAGGNWSMDGAPGADGNIGSYGFALAQLASMENFYSKLREGRECLIAQGPDGKPTVTWSYNPTLDSLVSSQQVIGVTGFSLGSHLATSFAILHQEARVYNYNSAGVGSINGAAPNSGNLGEVISFYNALMAWDGQRSTIPSSSLFVDLTALYDQSNDETPDNLSAIIPMRRLVSSASNTTPYGEKYQAILDLMKDSTLSSSGNGSVIGGTISIGIVQQMEALSRYIAGGGDPRELTFDHGEVYGWSDRVTQVFGHGLFFDPQNVANSGYHATPYFQFGVPIEDLPMSRAYGFLSMVPGTTGELLRQLIGDFGETHSIIPIVDSMTIISLFEKIDPTFGMDLFSTILTSVSNRIEEIPISSPIQYLPSFYENYQIDPDRLFDSDAIEIIINTLAEIVLGGGFTPVSGDYSNAEGFQDRDFRDRLHELASGIKNRLETASSPDRTVISFVGKSAAEISQLARTDIGALYALLKGNAFAIIGDGARSMHEVFNENGFLDHQKYSDQYLFDRANALHWKLRYQSGAVDDDDAQLRNLSVVGQAFMIQPNLGDKQFDSEWDSSDVIGDWDYSIRDFGQSDRDNDGQNDDIAFSIDGSVERMGDYLTTTVNHRIAFGNNAAESMTGGNNGDRLYGEGGNDQLDGGKGDDRLEGGDGFDVYIVGEGIDRILDRDRSGMILWRDPEYPTNYRILGINGVSDAENNWIELGPNTYWDRQNNVKYILSNDMTTGKTALYIFSSGRTDGKGIAIIEDYQSGDFGIVLQSESPVPLPTVTMNNDLVGSIQHDDPLTNVTNRDLRYDGLGGNDLLSGSVGNDRLAGGDGDDVLIGSMGADRMAGGDGNDFIGDDLHNIAIGAEDLSQITPAPAGATLVSSGKGWELWIGPDGAVILRYQSINPDTAPIPENNNDYASGGNGDDLIFMNWGDDAVDGGAGMDYIEGGHDSDMLDGGEGDDMIFGDEGARTGYYLDPALAARFRIDGNDRVSGGGGNDQIVGNGGQDYIDGGDDNDLIFGDNGREIEVNPNYDLSLEVSGKDMIDGGNGNDEIHGGGDDDHIDGGDGDDRIYGDNAQLDVGLSMYRQYDGDDVIDGGLGNDLVVGMGGDDAIAGGQGDDTLIGDHTSQIADLLAGNDTIFGEDGNDGIRGNGGNDYLDGGNGNDAMYGDDGNDILRGGAGNDLMDGGSGDDIYVIDANWGNDLIRGMDTGTDIVRFAAGINPTSLNVSIDWSTGRLLIQDPATGSVLGIEGYFEDSSSGRRIEFANGTVWAVNDILQRFPAPSGGVGTWSNETFVGGSTPEYLDGSIGDDVILGGSGDDTIMGGMGEGNYGSLTDNDVLFGGNGNDTIDGQRGDDYLYGDDGDDTLKGGEGVDRLYGGAGNDTLDAGDVRYTGLGFIQESSDDLLVGGEGDDSLIGGLGRNTYAFTSGFGHDRLHLTETFGYMQEIGAPAETAVLRFGTGISASSLDIAQVGDDLVITSGSDTLTIVGFALRNGASIEFLFDDGSTLSPAQSALVTTRTGTQGGDVLGGGGLNDVFDSLGGDDILRGGGGNDLFVGGAGLDTIYGGAGDDTIRYGVGDGRDHIYGSATDQAGFDTLELGAGINQSDVTLYRDGSALYVVVNATGNYVKANWTAGAGDQAIDLIRFADGSTLTSAQIDAMPLSAPPQLIFYGNAGGSTVTGNALSNDFNTISAGSTTQMFIGGGGDDRYVVGEGHYKPIIVEEVGGGIDTLYTQHSYYQLDDNIENLVATEGTWIYPDPRTLIGNALDNVIDVSGGGAYSSGYRLDGGAGADTLIGGVSNDTYVVDTIDDNIVEALRNTSIDTVEASISYDISNRIELENISLTGSNATSAIGNSLDNRLDGSTSTGINTLSGGLGNDTYILGDGDIVVESTNAGTDTIVISTGNVDAYSTAGLANVERYVLGGNVGSSSLSGGNGNDDLSGNTANNVLTGGDGDDTLRDRETWTNYDDTDQLYGGDGNDTLISIRGNDLLVGGRGDDTLQGNTATFTYSRGDGRDTIVGTGSSGTSKLRFDASVLPSDVHLSRTGDALVIDIGTDGADRITIQNFWTADTVTSPVNAIEFLDATGNFHESWPVAGLIGRLNAVTLTGGAGDDVLVGGIGYDILTGNDGNDTLDGGTGDDTLTGGAGNDTYLFHGDFGIDVVQGLNTAGSGIDILQFSAPYDSGNVSWTVDANDNLILTAINNGVLNQVTVEGFMQGGAPAHEIRLSDGTVWTSASIRAQALAATINADYIYGFGSNDTIDALAGDDYVYGRGGNDTIRGGDGADFLSGEDGDDHLYGNAGDDQLSGDAGTDILEGGTGNDTYYVSDSLDTIIEAASSGTDAVHASIDHTLAANVENLYLLDGAANGTGNTLNNRIEGNEQGNVLDGGAGNDTMLGGAGDDLYVVDSTGDVVTETAGNGVDTIRTTVTLTTLAANVENLILGGGNAINGTGNTLANVITGNSANNTLNGGGGADTLSGGGGNDTYIVDVAGDVVTELAGEGTDLVQAGVSYTLSANVENLSLTGNGTFTGTGNSLNNILNGNTANNTLNGGAGDDTLNGGAGTDTLIGGTGNDIYEVDTTTDVITELSGEGNDTIKSSVTFDMSGRANIENLTLTGSNAINGTGNSLDNVLTGNGVNNTLNGGAGNDTLDGGLGSDTMVGGTGDDIYHVNVSTDVVTELSGGGNDTVNSAVTFSAAQGGTNQHIENITLTGNNAINATGNDSANILIGNSGNNTIIAGAGSDTLEGGAGTDSLTGGTGNDTYRMARGYGADTAIENDTAAGNYDIARFLSGVAYDQLWFSRPSGSNNLEITIIGTTDKLVVKDWYLGNQYRTEEIQTVDGNRYLLATDVQTLVTAMAGLTPPAQGQTTLSSSQRTALNTALGAWKTRTSLMSSSLPADLQGNGQTQRRAIDGGLSDFIGGRRQYEDAVPSMQDMAASVTADIDVGDTRVAWNADHGFGRRSEDRAAEWHGIVFDRTAGHRRASSQAGGVHGSMEAPTCSKPASDVATCAKPVAAQSLEQEWGQPDAFDVMLPPLDLFMIPSTCDKTPESMLCGLPQSAATMVMSNCNRLIDLMAMASGGETAIGLLPQHDVARADRWTP